MLDEHIEIDVTGHIVVLLQQTIQHTVEVGGYIIALNRIHFAPFSLADVLFKVLAKFGLDVTLL